MTNLSNIHQETVDPFNIPVFSYRVYEAFSSSATDDLKRKFTRETQLASILKDIISYLKKKKVPEKYIAELKNIISEELNRE